MKRKAGGRVLRAAVAGMLGLAVLLGPAGRASAVLPAYAATREELEANKKAMQEQLDKERAALAELQNDKKEAEAAKASLEKQSQLITGQIGVLLDQITGTQQEVLEKQAEVEAKQAEVEAKQAEVELKQEAIRQRWSDFKSRLAAMQKLHDGGAVAMLANVSSLYELLTFNDTLQQISEKDNAVLDELNRAREELEAEKAQLEEQKAQLEAAAAALQNTLTQLESQQSQLKNKQNELATNIRQQDANISSADAAASAQAEVVKATIQKLNEASAALNSYVNSQNDKIASSQPDIQCSLNFGSPLASYKYITTRYGESGHRGVDLAAAQGTAIYAAADGVVSIAGSHWSYGNYVQIYHGHDENGNTYATLYAHMLQAPSVSEGQTVSKGDLIGYVGSTGYSFGNHLHLELRVNGSRTDPLSYIPA